MFFGTKSHYTIHSNYVTIFEVDAEMSEIFTDFSREKSQKNSAHWLQWVRNYWYLCFSPKLVMFLQDDAEGVQIHSMNIPLHGNKQSWWANSLLAYMYWSNLKHAEPLPPRKDQWLFPCHMHTSRDKSNPFAWSMVVLDLSELAMSDSYSYSIPSTLEI